MFHKIPKDLYLEKKFIVIYIFITTILLIFEYENFHFSEIYS